MTWKPCIVCGEPGETTRCPEHTRPDTRPRDRVTRNNNARWKNLSRRLRRQQPFCSNCGTTTDLTVDHITPLADGGDPYDLDNLDVLCRSCNSAKGRGDTPGRAPSPARGQPQKQLRLGTILAGEGSR